MPRRTVYQSFDREIDAVKGFHADLDVLYESIKDSLTSEKVDPLIREAVWSSLWNAKGWYAINGHLFSTDEDYLNEHDHDMPSNSVWVTNTAISKLEYIEQTLNFIKDALYLATSSSANEGDFWGYKLGFEDWRSEIYEHLKLIDDIYGSSVSATETTFLALEQLVEFNETVSEILENLHQLQLPNNLSFVKSQNNIDYAKISFSLFSLGKNSNDYSPNNEVNIQNVDSYNDLTYIELPELDEGQYLLRIKNLNKINIFSSERIEEDDSVKYRINLQKNESNLFGWYLQGKYPIIDFKVLDSNSKLYEIYIGNVFVEESERQFIEQRYIEPISIILDVKYDKSKNIYDFFYGNYIDEYIETQSNGNKIFYRAINDKDGNQIAAYQIEIDYTTTYNNGMPIIKYTRLDQ